MPTTLFAKEGSYKDTSMMMSVDEFKKKNLWDGNIHIDVEINIKG